MVDRFDWAGGLFSGEIPASQSVDLTLSYPLNEGLRLTLVGTNLFDQERYHLLGGSIVRRRILLGAAWSPR